MDENNIKRVILKYRGLIPEKILERDLEVYETKFDKANVIVGPRKAGKTFYLYLLIKKKSADKWVLINFEDNLLSGLDANGLNKIVDYSKELLSTEKLSFFFDEIQVIDGWEKFVISLLNEHYPVYITGSNSKLLSREIATSLRGKSLSYLLLPLSFSEYLRFNGIKLEKNFEYGNQAFRIKKYFREYLDYGGFPEMVLADSMPLKNKLINSYFDSILYRDLVDRLKLKNIKLVDIVIKYALNVFGRTFSISALEKYLKSNKIPYSLEDLYIILKSLQDVFMVGYVKEYSKSFKKSEISKAKVYLFDMGYVHFLSSEPNDYGRILENSVFIELFRRSADTENKSIFYHVSEKNQECDFIVVKKGNIIEAIQVAYVINPENRDREINGLVAAMEFFNLNNGLILTMDSEDEIKTKGKKITIMPVWKWMLKN
ncbi:TPA: ATP-binding protein [Candidatus Micrarchaeota archaeon]|nr:ATP-binding protein [Candidatus Micrarchaeota archaeon]